MLSSSWFTTLRERSLEDSTHRLRKSFGSKTFMFSWFYNFSFICMNQLLGLSIQLCKNWDFYLFANMYFIINFMDTLSFLGRVSIDVTKHHDQKYKVTEKRVFHVEEGQDRNSSRGGTWTRSWWSHGGMLYGLLHMACSVSFLIEPRTTSLGITPPTMDWTLLHPSLTKKMPYICIFWTHFLNWRSLLSVNSTLFQVDTKLPAYLPQVFS